ncbi:mitochondrial glycoprotein [Pisolithus croceorrhizus]|nr:mitochondrial glycoprotein [Pisolithus croceorrhizus]
MSATRALRQLTAVSSRVVAKPASRSLPLRMSMTAWRYPRLSCATTRAFSLSSARFSEGSTDVLLSQKLAEELKYEKEAADESEPEFLKTFKQQGIWKIEDIEGNDEVTLTRKFGNESIRVMFSIADIQNAEEPEFGQEEESDSEETENVRSYPIRVSFSITKEHAQGSINVDTMCQDGAFIVDNISYYPDAQLGSELTAEADWKRRGLYIGPQFETLDVSVQEEFEKFLQERGINEHLALFIPDYSELKEQKEYVRWLENVKKFVDA